MRLPNPCLGVDSEVRDTNTYDDYNKFSWVCYMLLDKTFKYASTMSWAPHWYTLRKYWNGVELALDPLRVVLYESVYCNDDVSEEQQDRAYEEFREARQRYYAQYGETDKEFAYIVRYMRKYGYNVQFGRTMYRCFDINDMKYWTMGYPIEMTQLINRAYKKSSFDHTSKIYDEKYGTSACLENDKMFSKVIRDYHQGGGNVLEIGCATGTFSGLYENYTGIDRSSNMIKIAKAKFPDRQFQAASLESFYTEEKFDFIFATYGTASYVADGYINTKMFDHLVYGGKFLLTYKNKESCPLLKMPEVMKHVDLCEGVGQYFVIGGCKNDD